MYKKIRAHTCLVTVLILSSAQGPARASAVKIRPAESKDYEKDLEWNRTEKTTADHKLWPVLRPFSESEKTGFVALSGASDDYEVSGMTDAIASHLPDDVTLLIYLADKSLISDYKKTYKNLFAQGRLKFLGIKKLRRVGSDAVWARDSLPYPVILKDLSAALVDSLYYSERHFEPDARFAKAFSDPMVSTHLFFRGVNLIADPSGNCFSENAREVAALKDPASFFKTFFGCATVTLLDHHGGIGDIDERLKFLDEKNAMTDDDDYAALLLKRGYTVHMITKVGDESAPYETYMNALLVNGTVFVPQMGKPNDAQALADYARAGLKPFGIYTREIADQGAGNIHCMTMNYPPGAFTSNIDESDATSASD